MFKTSYDVFIEYIISAHQVEKLRKDNSYIICGDVYRRDTIDSTHYPVFHQIDGGRIFKKDEIKNVDNVVNDLKDTLTGLVTTLFGQTKTRWVESQFPFTNNSLELETWFDGKWLELLGCGVIKDEILKSCGYNNYIGWAFGMGLERLAMPLFNIPDIRLFWSEDERFINQFKNIDPPLNPKKIPKFEVYSHYPPTSRDISFWESSDKPFNENDLCSIIRNKAGDLCESIQLVDHFIHPKTKKSSYCYRIIYRSMDRTLTSDEINEIQEKIRNESTELLHLILR